MFEREVLKCREIPARRDVEEEVGDVVIRECDMLTWFTGLVKARTDCCKEVRNELDDISQETKGEANCGQILYFNRIDTDRYDRH